MTSSGIPSLGAAIEVAAYRIGMEALTNAVRHSGATSIALTVGATADSLTVEVVDNGSGNSPWHPGAGITSMQERAALVGGTLIAGNARVLAVLPL